MLVQHYIWSIVTFSDDLNACLIALSTFPKRFYLDASFMNSDRLFTKWNEENYISKQVERSLAKGIHT